MDVTARGSGRYTRTLPLKADYGIDAPSVRRGMFIAGTVGLVVAESAMFAAHHTAGMISLSAVVMGSVAALAALYGFGMAFYMTYASRVGKLRTRERLLGLAQSLRPWTGDEKVLDVGCGRGLMMIGAAQRLTTGKATGIDLWRLEDQAENTPDAALENARREGVSDRITVETGDACALPFQDAAFDVVVSHWVIHNISASADRARALDEMMRVLRPNGVLVLADIEHLSDYRKHLTERGLLNLQVHTGGMGSRVIGALSGGTFRPQAIIGSRSVGA